MDRTNITKQEIKIRITGLSNGHHEYNFSADPSILGLGGNFKERVEINSLIDKTSHQIYMQTQIGTTGVFQCDRCLDDYEQTIETSYKMFYLSNNTGTLKTPTEEIKLIGPETTDIDLTDDIRQMVLLSVPLKLLCADECNGLCPRCGFNLNRGSCNCKEVISDPRYQGIQDLLDK